MYNGNITDREKAERSKKDRNAIELTSAQGEEFQKAEKEAEREKLIASLNVKLPAGPAAKKRNPQPEQTITVDNKSEKDFKKDVGIPVMKMAGKASAYAAGALGITGVFAAAATYGIGALTTAATVVAGAATTATAALGISNAGGILASLGTLGAGAVATGGFILAAAVAVAAVTLIAYGAYKLYQHYNAPEKEKDTQPKLPWLDEFKQKASGMVSSSTPQLTT